ncbi:hypothetical protein SCL_1587 [Sulfuricaulis limicola]|uniref:IPTL-CTERM protein sorting domain-containing protein n=1 Tax=Sulfuricaulis limicola TaxID=1620215 RepID=A0A1B4XGF0_9GAMM|nr:hypothetical protein [Sulfuricaulis limicola]BAV33892.1 hypothetical protein SCL_1587 [Sulfuricaulis limicola]
MSKTNHISIKQLLCATAFLVLWGAAPAANAAVSATNSNFTMLDGTGATVGGTNDVVFTWDGTLNTDVNTAVSNATISSVTPFFGINWTAYNVKIYGPGTYTISTADTAGQAGCPTVLQANCASGGDYTVTVPAGRIMTHMKFAWGSTEGIDVIDVWTPGNWSVLNPGNPIYRGAGGIYAGPVYSLVSTDWDSDGIAGGAMVDGPFQGFNANFNIPAVSNTTNNNFTMLDGTGATVGGTNDVVFTWDGTLNTDVNTAVSNATISSVTPFFGINWTAYNVKIYGPGTYTISTADTAGQAGCPTVLQANCASGGDYTVTVPAGRIMTHMKFAWGSTEGIDVIDVWTPGNWSVLNPGNPIYRGAGGIYAGPVYSLVSTDWDSDGIAGGAMVDGPFQGFNANFNVNAGGVTTIVCTDCTDPNQTAPEPSTAGGCSISTKPVNARERGDWWLVAGFLAWLGLIINRRKTLKN